jgi:hypothetical protein
MTTAATRSIGRRDEMASSKTWARAVIAAAAIGCCGVMTAATAVADPPDFDLSHHPAHALAAGVGIGTYDGDGQPRLASPSAQEP